MDVKKRENEFTRDSVEELRKRLDSDVWKSLYEITGLGDHFDTQAREQFSEQLRTDPPPVSVENLLATCLNMAGSQGEIFERSVHNLFRRLSRNHKSNNGFCFGGRFIFWGVVHGYSDRWRDLVRDLERVVLTLSRVPVPDRCNSVIRMFEGALKKARKEVDWPEKTAGTYEDAHFHFKWFKNGNLHVRLKNHFVINELNKIIADENVLNSGPVASR